MAIDAQIPLSGAQQPSFAQNAGQAFQLAGAMEKQQEIQQEKQDQQFFQQGLQEGANFDTPEGISAFAEKAKGKVSPKSYMMLTQAAQEAKSKQAQMQEHLVKAGDDVIEGAKNKLDFMKSNVEEPLAAYDDAIKAGKKPEEATLAFEASKAQKKQQLESLPQVGGKPAIEPQAIDGYMKGNVAQFRAKFDTVKSHQDTLMAAEKLRHEKAGTELELEKTRALKKAEAGEAPNPDDVKSLGAQIASGMPLVQVIPGLSKNASGKRDVARREAIRQIQEENPGMSPTEAGVELAQRGIDYASSKTGRMQQERTIAATGGNITMASSEARKMIAIINDVSTKMDLTEFPSVNAVQNAVSKGTGGEPVVRLNAALNGLINTYARAINPRGVPTVEDKREARIVINNAMSSGQIRAALEVMDQEMEASLQSPNAARKVLERVKKFGDGKEKPEKSTAVPHGTNDFSHLWK